MYLKRLFRLAFLLALSGATLSACSDDNVKVVTCDEEHPCEGELKCVEGSCMLPLELGDDCTVKNAFCSEGKCLDGICKTPEVDLDVCDVDHPCADGEFCDEGKCKNKVQIGDACSSETYCVEGSCQSGICRGDLDLGEACTQDAYCLQGMSCKDGKCQLAVALDGACEDGKRYCEEGLCLDGICKLEDEELACSESNPCEDGLSCVDGKCLTPLTLGEDCTIDDAFCSEGECLNGVCTALEDILDACDEEYPCAEGYFCDAGLCKAEVQLGETCDVITHCVEGVCKGGVCSVEVVDLTCHEDKPCESGMHCVEGLCKPEVQVGDACDGTTYCVNGTCESGICKGNGALGDACIKTVECADPYVCHEDFCQVPVMIGGDCSKSMHFCKEGSCVEGLCLEPDSEAVLRMLDTDGDTISDYYDRCDEDTDGDTIPNCQGLDSDGDTIPDAMEAYNGSNIDVEPIDTDRDGIYDFLDLDSDNNGILDATEGKRTVIDPISGDISYDFIDTDNDTILDSSDIDNDDDGLIDVYEIRGYPKGRIDDNPPGGTCGHHNGAPGTPADPWDCDGDTVPDYNDPDSDGDTILDYTEGLNDSNNDGIYDRYSLDSDGDTLPDSIERGCTGYGCRPLASFNNVYDYRTPDIDSDGLRDGSEVNCPSLGKHSKYSADTDGDGYNDASEHAAALASDGKFLPADLICNPAKGVKDVFDFYFELPYEGPQKNDVLLFKPAVSKLDLIFNVDTTGSMSGTINSVKTGINGIITKTRAAVSDSGFGLTVFDDFPVSGYGSGADLPFRLLGPVSTNAAVVQQYTQNALFKTRYGNDGPESGVESLYQIATGAGVAWTGGSIAKRTPSAGRWGGVDFRPGSLPVVVHATDATSHDATVSPYNTSYVPSPHYSSHLIPILKSKGIRVIGLDVGNADSQGQLTNWAKESNAIVPVCAFKNTSGAWVCGANKCCTSTTGDAPVGGKCTLKFKIAHSEVANNVSIAVDALVKYGIYDVSTVIRRDPTNSAVNTACFVKQVSALRYIAPPQEPERSCNPVAQPAKIGESAYNNGFSNFATGTSSTTRPGASLEFTVLAQNDNCVAPTETTQVFKAYIDVVNPTTGLVFGTRHVSIIVPPKKIDIGN